MAAWYTAISGMAGQTAPRPPQAQRKPPWYAVNVVLVMLTGVVISVWVLTFTDFFAVIGGLLGAGGALLWVTVVWKLLPEGVSKAFRDAAVDAVFRARWTGLACLLCLAAGTWFAAQVGTIEVVAAPDAAHARVWLQPLGVTSGVDEFSVAAGARKRYLRAAPGTYLVRVRGYPERTVDLAGLDRVTLTVPYSFLRPVVLARTTVAAMTMPPGPPVTLVVRINGQKELRRPFDGHPVWIGCSGLQLSQSLLDAWKADLATQGVGDRLLDPQPLSEPPLQLEPGDLLELSLEREGFPIQPVARHLVRPVSDATDFVQSVTVDPPRKE